MTTFFIIAAVIFIIYIIYKVVKSDDSDDDSRTNQHDYLHDSESRESKSKEFEFDLSFKASTTDIGAYLIFDVETTGLPKNRYAGIDELENWPRIVQICWILLDTDFNCVNTETCYLNQDSPIPKEATRIHHIDDKVIKEKGLDPKLVFQKFQKDFQQADYLIAHNIDFDLPIIESELYRLEISKPFKGKRKICTMKLTTDYCKIPSKNGSGYKYPKLEELAGHLFFPGVKNIKSLNAHDTLIDTALTAKCFIELLSLRVITLTPKTTT